MARVLTLSFSSIAEPRPMKVDKLCSLSMSSGRSLEIKSVALSLPRGFCLILAVYFLIPMEDAIFGTLGFLLMSRFRDIG